MIITVDAGDPPLYKEGEIPNMIYENERGQKLFIIQLRNNRNIKLEETDKYMLPDYPISVDNLEKIKIYRKELRDFFQKDNFINLNLPDFPF
jgi:hypothetical protein